MSVNIRRETTIDSPVDSVWPYLADPHRELDWRQPEVVDLQIEDGHQPGVGARYHGTTRVMGQTDTYVNEVTEWVPPRLVGWRGIEESGPVTTHGRYTLEPIGDRTRAAIDITYEAKSLRGRLMLPVIRVLGGRTISRFAQQLKDVAEQRPAD